MKKEEEGLVAVIIGIDGYKDLKPLHCAVNDAVSFTEALKKVWKNRRTIINTLIWPHLDQIQAKKGGETWGIERPKDASVVTRTAILSAVRECALQARETDTFIFYFSGHGAIVRGEPALITIGDGKTAEGVEYINIREIQQAAANCASVKKVIIMDCPQSSSTKNQIVDGYKNLENLTQEWSIFLASSPGEASLEDRYYGDSSDDYLQQGIFTASLVEGLRGGAADSKGSVSLTDLFLFVSKRVSIEYEERLLNLILLGGGRKKRKDQVKVYDREKEKPTSQVRAKTRAWPGQNPVLLSKGFAMGGPYQIIMAPEYVPGFLGARKKVPGKNFITYLYEFLLDKWPIQFPYKSLLREGGALLYALTMFFTLLIHCPKTTDNTIQLYLGCVALGSAFLWWVTLAYTVSVNEERWYPGGFVPTISYGLWHCVIALSFAWICGGGSGVDPGLQQLLYLAADLFLILMAVVIFGCNASQTIIALAETIRPGERREIRQAIRAFQQFKYKMLGVDLFNFVPMVPARPGLYLYIWVLSTVVIAFHIYQTMVAAELESVHISMIVIRDIVAFCLITWLVFWYQAAFRFIRREVYKR